MWLVDQLHQAGIGVILDWVPSHFPWDPHGLGFFDGTHLFEHSDPRQGHHPDWASAIFNDAAIVVVEERDQIVGIIAKIDFIDYLAGRKAQ